MIDLNDPKIVTEYEPKPGPHRDCDWSAVYGEDGGESGIGYGATEAEAVSQLTATFPWEG